MKKYTYFPILLLLIIIACNQNENHSKIILETTGFADSTKIILYNYETQISDTGFMLNNMLVFNAQVKEPTLFSIRNIAKSREAFDNRMFWKEDKQLNIKALTGKLKTAIIEGSEIQIQADLVDARKNHFKQINDSLVKVYRSLPKEETEKRAEIRAQGLEMTQAITDVETNYIENNPEELFSAISLKNLMSYTIPKDKTIALYENLSIRLQSTKYGKTIKKYLDISLDLKVGDQAVDFQLPGLDGNLIGLSSFKGKYILLDFWSSGCGPCRIENPNLLRNYRAYRDQGFEIISISFDKNRKDWADAVKQDSMIWTTVCDLKGGDGDVIMTYNVYFMPTYFLIDPDGIIIDKFMGRGQLDGKLEKIFPD